MVCKVSDAFYISVKDESGAICTKEYYKQQNGLKFEYMENTIEKN